MSLVRRSFLILLSVKMLMSATMEKRAATCDIDLSIPCKCTNPFQETDDHFRLGDPKHTCKRAKACYVANLSGCSDVTQARGGGRCTSKEACIPVDTLKPSTVGLVEPTSNIVEPVAEPVESTTRVMEPVRKLKPVELIEVVEPLESTTTSEDNLGSRPKCPGNLRLIYVYVKKDKIN
jgi:hypothetical protein